jgi:hypothetical protein
MPEKSTVVFSSIPPQFLQFRLSVTALAFRVKRFVAREQNPVFNNLLMAPGAWHFAVSTLQRI